jgi:hypothetical protein
MNFTVAGAQTGITAATDVTGTSVTITAVANRRYRVTAKVNVSSTVTTDTAIVTLLLGATVQVHWISPPLANEVGCNLSFVTISTLTAGSNTYKLQLARNSGTGTLSNLNSVNDMTFLMVEDVGPLGPPI